jgi:hypothetical protein
MQKSERNAKKTNYLRTKFEEKNVEINISSVGTHHTMKEMENHPAKLLVDGHCIQESASQINHDHDGSPDTFGASPINVAIDHNVGVNLIVI